MERKIKFITGNIKKFGEAGRVLAPVKIEQLKIDLEEIQSLDVREVLIHKLNEARRHYRGDFFAEDSAMYMDALGGKLPGPLVKWFNDTIGNAGYHKIARKMGNGRASAKTVIGLMKQDGKAVFFEGEMKGKIVKPAGDYRFGYDPVFMPDGAGQTLAQSKSKGDFDFSPRGVAFKKLKQYLLNEK